MGSNQYNLLLGNRMGKPSYVAPPRPTKRQKRTVQQERSESSHRARQRYKAARQGMPSVASSIRSAARRGSGIGGGSSQRIESAMENVYNQVVSDYQQNLNKEAAIQREMSANASQEEPNPGGLMGAISNIPYAGDAITNTLSAVVRSPVGSFIDWLSRPAYGLYGGINNVVGGEGDIGGFNVLGDIASEFWRGAEPGLQGRAKTGFGEIWETMKHGDSPVGRTLTRFEEEHPVLEQMYADIFGAAGEFGLDPLNLAAPAAPNILRETGEVATREVMSQFLRNMSDNAIDEFAQSSSRLSHAPLYYNAPDDLAARVGASVEKSFNDANVTVLGGGAAHSRTLNPRAAAELHRESWTQDMLDSLTEHTQTDIRDVFTNAGKMSPADITARLAANPGLQHYWDRLTRALQGSKKWARHVPTGSIDEVLNVIQASKGGRFIGDNLLNKLWMDFREGYWVELQPYSQRFYENVRNPTRRSIGIRIGGRTAEIPLVGHAFGHVGSRLAQIPGIEAAGKLLYERAFPGLFANKISRARAYGIRGFDEFRDELEKMARNYSPDEAVELLEALEKNLPTLGNARKDNALFYLRQKLNEMHLNEKVEGARSVNDKMIPDYIPIHLKGGTQDARREFLKGREDAFRQYGNSGEYSLQKARDMGLKPEDDAFEALLIRYMKSGNDIGNSYLWQDIVANYAVGGRPLKGISKHELSDRGLVDVASIKGVNLGDEYRQIIEREGGKFYIPKEMANFGKRFNELMEWGGKSNEWGIFRRGLSKVMNAYKVALTLPHSGFHIRNFTGDTMMGMLDGVLPTEYIELLRKYGLNKANKASKIRIAKGWEVSFDELMQLFKQEANSGFINIDEPLRQTMTAGRIPRRLGRKAYDVFRDFSNNRELLPRVTHYLHALREESNALIKSGITDLDVVMSRSRDAALWRVNHYKFDYNALMPWERQLKSLAFPFYTYTRKAIPALLEQMYINPHLFSTLNRYQQYNDGSDADRFNSLYISNWMRDMGFSTLTDEKEPLMLTGDIFPTNTLEMFNQGASGGDAMDMAGGFFRDILKQVSPLGLIPTELATGKTAFDNAPINEGLFDYLMGKIPLVGDLVQEGGNGEIGGQVRERVRNILPGGEGDFDVWRDLISPRFLGAGIPIRRDTQGQQQQQMEYLFDQLIEDPTKAFNYSQDRFSVNMNGEGNFAVYDKVAGDQIGPVFTTAMDAISFAKKLPTFTAPQQNMFEPPNQQFINQTYQALTQ